MLEERLVIKEKPMTGRMLRVLGATCLLIVLAAPAQAQWAVIDAPAIVQLIQQVQTLEQQLATARDELTLAKQTLQSTMGDRGMERLLGGTTRNYLPSSWAQLTSAMQGSAGSSGLAAEVRDAMTANAILPAQQLALLSVPNQQRIVAARQAAALQQALSQEALANASGRFASIQTLVAAISGATDQKAILDLQARISAEVGMLQNEQTKLQILNQATHARDAINAQQEREEVIAAQGRFDSRFQPTP